MDGYVFVVNDHAFALSRHIEIEICNTLPTFLGPNFMYTRITAERYAGQSDEPPCCGHR